MLMQVPGLVILGKNPVGIEYKSQRQGQGEGRGQGQGVGGA